MYLYVYISTDEAIYRRVTYVCAAVATIAAAVQCRLNEDFCHKSEQVMLRTCRWCCCGYHHCCLLRCPTTCTA